MERATSEPDARVIVVPDGGTVEFCRRQNWSTDRLHHGIMLVENSRLEEASNMPSPDTDFHSMPPLMHTLDGTLSFRPRAYMSPPSELFAQPEPESCRPLAESISFLRKSSCLGQISLDSCRVSREIRKLGWFSAERASRSALVGSLKDYCSCSH